VALLLHEFVKKKLTLFSNGLGIILEELALGLTIH